MRDIFQEITDRIAAQLEKGVKPWSKPWKADESFSSCMPHNVDRRPYRGANVCWLWMIAEAKGYTTPMWMTFKQAKANGGNVKKGEQGTLVFFWKFSEREDDDGKKSTSVMVRQYTVFNLDQTEGVKVKTLDETPKTEAERIAYADELINATGAKIKHGGNRAFYVPSQDFITMPNAESFRSVGDYYSTMFHEIGHWTGHESRLKRDFSGRFGNEAYAFEELIAELTSAFVCGSQGFAAVDRDDHADYIGSWIKVLKSDPKAFIKAAGEAQKAADLILGVNQAKASEESEESQAA